MHDGFDPYRKWLGIPPAEQPPNHYRLLGVPLLEDDAETISHAADQRMSYVRTLAVGDYIEATQKLLNELAAAKVCLLNPGKKAAYDRQLRARAAEVSAPLTSPPRRSLVSPPGRSVRMPTPAPAPIVPRWTAEDAESPPLPLMPDLPPMPRGGPLRSRALLRSATSRRSQSPSARGLSPLAALAGLLAAVVLVAMELQQIVREAAVGRRYVDKLFKVWLNDGAEAWVLIHVEIQSQRDEDFGERMYLYHGRLYGRYRRPVVSLAVLGDEHPGWRPNHFGYSLGGCKLGFEFPVAKLLDYGANLAGLEADPNPFAPFVIAHLKTMETRQDMVARKGWKVRLLKGLFERGFAGDEIRQLLRLIDWMMDLPEEMEEQVQEEMVRFGEEKNMPYVTSFERIGFKKGKAEGEAKGKAEATLRVLGRRFGNAVPADLEALIRATTDLERLDRWLDLAVEAASLGEFQRLAQP